MAGKLYDELVRYCAGDAYPFHMPGHKRRLGSMQDPFSFDITEIDGFDNLHHAQGILLEAEERAAALYGSEETCFLVNGSTCGVLSAIGALVRPGGTVLMARNSHKSAYHAVYLNGLHARYLLPREQGPGSGPVFAEDVERELEKDRQRCLSGETGIGQERQDGRFSLDAAAGSRTEGRIEAVYITSPTYDGVVSDVRAIARAAHRYGVPLIVDEAHGAHFGMHPMFPESSVKAGADIVIHSLHKTLPSLTQTALLHMNGGLVDRRRVRQMLDIYQTSSPSYVLMAGIDSCVSMMSERGKELFDRYHALLSTYYRSVGDLRHIHHIRTDDPSKILLCPDPGRMTAKRLYELLLGRYHIQPEMLAPFYVLMLSAVGDDESGFMRLSEALHELDHEMDRDLDHELDHEMDRVLDQGAPGQSRGEKIVHSLYGQLPQRAMTISQAILSQTDVLPLEKAVGRISAEYLFLYPPGIPLIAPGEVLSQRLADGVRKLREQGYELQGPEDYSLQTIRTVKEPDID